MSFIRRMNEEQMIIEMSKGLYDKNQHETVWYLVEMDDLGFEKVSIN